MGINPTPTNHRSFTFDGKSTREFGVYITGKDVFNSPERAVEMISIPGRDGEYALDQGHFNNIEVTYRAGIVADSTTDFAEAISNFRNWLASREGYCRLTDEYNTEEYRMAVFKNAIALEHEGLLTGEFDVTFDCKPQRFLAIGEELTEIGAWGNTETAEGEVVTIDASSDTAVKALTADIDPIQDLNGYDAPWVGGAGKNKLQVTATTSSPSGVTVTVGSDGVLTLTGTATASINFVVNQTSVLPDGTYILNGADDGSSGSRYYLRSTRGLVAGQNVATQYTSGDALYVFLHISSGTTFPTGGEKVYPMIRLASDTDASWQPYENICPISGFDSIDVIVSPTLNAQDGTTYTTPLPQTVYGGTLDVTSGVLTVNSAMLTLNTANMNNAEAYPGWTNSGVRALVGSGINKTVSNVTMNIGTIYGINTNGSNDSLFLPTTQYGKTQTEWKALAIDVQAIIELATPQTYQLTPQQVELLLGENNIFADSGNVTVEYGHNPTLLTNPTWFPSKPLLEVEGYGDINLGKHKIEVENVPIGDVSLAPGTSFYLENRTQTFSLDADKYNEGDIITVAVDQIGFDYSISTNTSAHAHSTTATDSMSGVTSTVKADTNFWGTSCLFYGTTKPSSITFTAGTSANFVNEVSGRLTIQLETLALRNILYTLTETVSYDATQNTISFSLSSTTSYDAAEVRSAELRNRFTPSKIDGINVFSTISAVDGTVYIDCEVGECWNVNGDVILPLNNVISLGSDLPTLPPGDTEVTYDNTITKVEVQPNWWKV